MPERNRAPLAIFLLAWFAIVFAVLVLALVLLAFFGGRAAATQPQPWTNPFVTFTNSCDVGNPPAPCLSYEVPSVR